MLENDLLKNRISINYPYIIEGIEKYIINK